MNRKLALTAIVMVAAIMGIGSVAPAAFAAHNEDHVPPGHDKEKFPPGQNKDEGCGVGFTSTPVDPENAEHVAADENGDGTICIGENPNGKALVVDNEIEEEEEPEEPEEE